ncbi:MAG TPA: hypothetical protein VFQ13_19405, partial [Anaerolineales bacterium]|nr:hypothetical protein [Anaerolineales bacterium]
LHLLAMTKPGTKKTGRKTMKRIAIGLLSGMLILAACRQVPAGDGPSRTAPPVITIQSATETPSPTPISTSVPTETPIPSITPLPTIPTFTPTFDASTIVTVTPAQPAACPKENPAIIAEFATPDAYGSYQLYNVSEILTYLNSGGTLTQLTTSPLGSLADSKTIDLTGDGVNELTYKGYVTFDILGCKDGKYQSLFNFVGDWEARLEDTPDLNKNGIPELILYDITHYGSALFYIFEWNGMEFRSRIDMGEEDWDLSSSPGEIMDANGDALKEIVVVYDVNKFCGGLGNPCDGTPARKQTTTLAWNGRNYVVRAQDSDAPQYRFQAIQDGDLQARYGYYSEALSFYQATIFDDRLEWWSPEREEYERRTYWAQYDPTPTVYPTAILDSTEYPRLATYAYYRIMLLHIVQGHESDAGTVYKTLQQKFGNDPYGHPYVEMATAFWNAYQSTHKMYDGCAAGIQYASEHPEILIPLGSDYHGWQSPIYVPADVCPFR